MIYFFISFLVTFPAYGNYDVYWKWWKVGEMKVHCENKGDTIYTNILMETKGMWKSFYNFKENWTIVGGEDFIPRYVFQYYEHGKRKGQWIYNFDSTYVLVDKKDTLFYEGIYRDVFSALFSLAYFVPDTVKVVHHKKLYNFIPEIKNRKKDKTIIIKGKQSTYGIVYDKKDKMIKEMIISTSWGNLKAKKSGGKW